LINIYPSLLKTTALFVNERVSNLMCYHVTPLKDGPDNGSVGEGKYFWDITRLPVGLHGKETKPPCFLPLSDAL
jgi:hypothetical protein